MTTQTKDFQDVLEFTLPVEQVDAKVREVAQMYASNGFSTLVARSEEKDGLIQFVCVAAKLPPGQKLPEGKPQIVELSQQDAAKLGLIKSAEIAPSSLSFGDIPRKS